MLAAPLLSGWNFSLDAGPGTVGAAGAAGALLWAHGKAGEQDQRALPPPKLADCFTRAGFDLWRFDRNPVADETQRAAGWMRECLRALRRRGYRRIVVLGQSRGGWNALQMLHAPGLADAIVAISPAAQGLGLGQLSQMDAWREIVDGTPASAVRLAVVQFAGDAYDADAAGRARLLGLLRNRIGALLLIDRPAGFFGHAADYDARFAPRFGGCLLDFVRGGAAACAAAG